MAKFQPRNVPKHWGGLLGIDDFDLTNPDRGQYVQDVTHHFCGNRHFAAIPGWPDMIQTVTHNDWMGLLPAGKKATMCRLDFWQIKNRMIRGNSGMVEILDVDRQLNVDALVPTREFSKACVQGTIPYPVGDRPVSYLTALARLGIKARNFRMGA